MADKPILFSGPMVRALLAGAKTQTRRILNPQPPQGSDLVGLYAPGLTAVFELLTQRGPDHTAKLRYLPKDRLYVREHWRCGGSNDHLAPRDLPPEWAHPIEYYADLADIRNGRFRQGMHMPRWASRLTLTVTDVRVERLQDITEADALAEGMTQATADAILSTDELQVFATTHIVAPQARGRILYETIWDQINGAGSWDANPWVAAYSFTVERGNIDQLRAAP